MGLGCCMRSISVCHLIRLRCTEGIWPVMATLCTSFCPSLEAGVIDIARYCMECRLIWYHGGMATTSISGEFLECFIDGTMTADKNISPTIEWVIHSTFPSADVCRDFLFGKCRRRGLLFDVSTIVRTAQHDDNGTPND